MHKNYIEWNLSITDITGTTLTFMISLLPYEHAQSSKAWTTYGELLNL